MLSLVCIFKKKNLIKRASFGPRTICLKPLVYMYPVLAPVTAGIASSSLPRNPAKD